jgi:hypothetical protein
MKKKEKDVTFDDISKLQEFSSVVFGIKLEKGCKCIIYKEKDLYYMNIFQNDDPVCEIEIGEYTELESVFGAMLLQHEKIEILENGCSAIETTMDKVFEDDDMNIYRGD